MLVHATAVARHDAGGWSAALLTGLSGSGKSDLALRLIDRGWRLIADDQSFIWRSGPSLYVGLDSRIGANISGRIEVRGLGIMATSRPPLHLARLRLVCVCGRRDVERMPDGTEETYFDLSLPKLEVDARPASAVLVVEAALRNTTRL